MIPETGHFSLILALTLALVQASLPLAGAARSNRAWMAVARPAAQAQFACVAIAFGCLLIAFAGNDFSVLNVANNSNSQLPLQYRLAAAWGSHEGSLLLWVLILAGWTFAVAQFSASLPAVLVARVLGVLGLVSAGFLLFTLLTSNPFARLLPAASEGRDLNPLLQDPGMVIHPPLLYMGYVGFSVTYAFAVAALLGGRLDATWARWCRPWTLLAWSFLTCGIAVGSWWAYYELGWGGWWFWDPVENASFMPWLAGTALLHSLAVTEKRGAFANWTALLAICTFGLSLLGTFLVRSGILTSVHAFAADPSRGVFMLMFLVLVVGASLALFAWRAPRAGLGGSFDMASRESLLLANNVFLAATLGCVLLGTLYPLFMDALQLGKISVGPPYFEAVFVPMIAPALFLMGAAPLVRWKQASLPDLARQLRGVLAGSLSCALFIVLATGRWRALVFLGLALALWIAAASAASLHARMRRSQGSISERLRTQSSSYYGMLLAHCGVAVFVAGVTLVKAYEVERDVRLKIGDSVEVAGYAFRFTGVEQVAGPNYRAARGTMHVSRDGRPVTVLQPEKRIYAAANTPMTEAAIDSGLLGDLYVSLGEALGDGAWSVRVYVKPFVTWIWAGCALMALGALLAFADRRYRFAARRDDHAIHAAQSRASPLARRTDTQEA